MLTVTNLHPAIPALTAGMAIALTRQPDGGYTVEVPGTANVMERILAAVKDGALELTNQDTVPRELREAIEADWSRLMDRIELLSQAARAGAPAEQAS
jgi:hypothetical protein